MPTGRERLSEAKARLVDFKANAQVKAEAEQQVRIKGLRDDMTAFCDAMDIYPDGIDLDATWVLAKGSGLPEEVRAMLLKQYEAGGSAHRLVLRSTDTQGSSGIFIALVDDSVEESHEKWVIASAFVDMFKGEFGFTPYTREGCVAGAVKEEVGIEQFLKQFEGNTYAWQKNALEFFARPMMDFAVDAYTREVNAEIEKGMKLIEEAPTKGA